MSDSDYVPRYIPVNERCKRCHGTGELTYGSTATWRGGIGGAAMTVDVCDHCWGSGKEDKPWPSHRTFEALKRAKSPRAPNTIEVCELCRFQPMWRCGGHKATPTSAIEPCPLKGPKS